ncbi:hypothetical protein [Bacillus swezeyi]|uniref:Uncharacterized protein n=1 Tax=Bacillus swezeyi TaxID=1925020 RepID=A0A5M8REE7_9BACI|nr:hypothetical protein [Bacillus swezeyi]KAA6446977.1 hypothetical protein DX927_23315 [Bacillus swezeyi]KAA6471545.1 hypothetical protein DX928_23555 [Bacillus swezeyi]
MELQFRNHTPIANKWLIVLSGINKLAKDKQGKKLYEQHHFHIPKSWLTVRWTRTLIKQTIAYLSLSDSKGQLGVIPLNKLSSTIGCSIRTVVNNNKVLESLELIKVNSLWGNLVSIELKDYKENFLDLYPDKSDRKQHHGAEILSEEEVPHYSKTGYTTIKREAIFDLFKINNVNELRMACRALYIYEKEVNVGGNETAHITYQDLKGILPKYFAFKANIKKAFSVLKSLFSIQPLEKEDIAETLLTNQKATPSLIEKLKSPFIIMFSVRDDKDSRHIHKREYIEGGIVLDSFCFETKIKPIPEIQQQSLIFEFGLETVRRAIRNMLTIFNDGYTEERSKLVDGLDFKPIQTLRNYMKQYQGGHIA